MGRKLVSKGESQFLSSLFPASPSAAAVYATKRTGMIKNLLATLSRFGIFVSAGFLGIQQIRVLISGKQNFYA